MLLSDEPLGGSVGRERAMKILSLTPIFQAANTEVAASFVLQSNYLFIYVLSSKLFEICHPLLLTLSCSIHKFLFFYSDFSK